MYFTDRSELLEMAGASLIARRRLLLPPRSCGLKRQCRFKVALQPLTDLLLIG